MEELRSLIPSNLKRTISESTSETLTLSCSSLLEFLLPLPQFQRVIGDLTDPKLALCRKSKEKSLGFKKKGNECFSKGDYPKALSFYSQALRYAPMTNGDMDESFVATLYVNRGSSVHKMGLLEECIRDCNRAIVLSPTYVKAWYRRGKANASFGNYEAAIHDLEISIILEGSSSGKKQIKGELDLISNHFNDTAWGNHSRNNVKQTNAADFVEKCEIKLQCVTTTLKGRGMVAPIDIPPASLLHNEEPIAV
ncbi:uncharacterized protein A4U43_C10F16070 [Asparagus officinalis]|nr:uncharacterized protein A4U43_C10F16070 [Asparagus officinalis]